MSLNTTNVPAVIITGQHHSSNRVGRDTVILYVTCLKRCIHFVYRGIQKIDTHLLTHFAIEKQPATG